jgi:uncharacterized protein YndB with AHSA1/START domain
MNNTIGSRHGSAVFTLPTDDEFEMFPDAGAVSTVTFEETNGVTTLKILGQYPSKDHRDAALASGMEGGLQTSLDELEDLVRQAA